jgi:hypothetical protein
MAVPLIAAAIAYGLRVVGLRIIPYLVREGTRMAIKRGGSIGSPTVARKVGTQKITETGYIVVTNNPNKFSLAQKIFGKDKVFKSDILAARSTSSRSYQAITEKTFKNLSPEIKRTVAGQMDDAANGVSRFIINPKSNPAVGGTKVTEHFNKLFGQKIKFTEKTLKIIAKAEQGPTALGKGIIKAPIRAGTTVGKPVLAAKEGTKKIIKEFKEKLVTPKIPVRTGKEIVTQKTITEKAPWYVAIMPRFLRTTKETLKHPDLAKNIYASERTVTPAISWGKVAAYGTAATAVPAALSGLTPEKEDKDMTRDLDYNQLFGQTELGEKEDLDIPSEIQVFSE